MKEEALKLADYLEDGVVTKREIDEASAMIRRLVEELDKLGKGDYIEGWEEGYQACKNDYQLKVQTFNEMTDEERKSLLIRLASQDILQGRTRGEGG